MFTTCFIAVNWAKPPFDIVQMRQAFALTKQIFVDGSEQGTGA